MQNKYTFRLFLILGLTIVNIVIVSQTTYSYDASGNRIQRNYVVVKSNMVVEENDTTVHETDEELLLLLQQEKMKDSIADIINAENATLSSETINVSLFPNPTVNTVTITAEAEIIGGKVYILNDAGTLLHQQTYQNNMTLQLGHLPKGNYLVRLITSDQKQFIWNVVKM